MEAGVEAGAKAQQALQWSAICAVAPKAVTIVVLLEDWTQANRPQLSGFWETEAQLTPGCGAEGP